LQALLDINCAQTEKQFAEQLGVTMAQQAISICLHTMRKLQKEGRWIPYELSEDNKNRHDTALILLSKLRKTDFLHKIIQAMKSGFLMNLKHRKSCVDPGSTSTPKPNIYAKKVLLCIWWDWKGVLYYELLQPGEPIRLLPTTIDQFKRCIRRKEAIYWPRTS